MQTSFHENPDIDFLQTEVNAELEEIRKQGFKPISIQYQFLVHPNTYQLRHAVMIVFVHKNEV